MINESMKGKVVVVTGANSGMGKIIATDLAKKGCTFLKKVFPVVAYLL